MHKQIILAFLLVGSTGIGAAVQLPWDGDANGDCKVNVLDLVLVRNCLNQDVGTGDNAKADVNRDGRINIQDLIYVRNRLNRNRATPDAPTSIAEDSRGNVYFAFAAEDGALVKWDGSVLGLLDTGMIGDVAVDRDDNIWYTRNGRVMTVAADGSTGVVDRTDAFGGPASPPYRVFAGRLNTVWVEGCPMMRTSDGAFAAVPADPFPEAAPVPVVEDQFGNTWGLASGGIAGYGYPATVAPFSFHNVLWAYDPAENQWSQLPPMSTRRGYCGIAAFNGEIWVLGGFTLVDGGRVTVNEVEIYNTQTRQWRPGPSLPQPRAELIALAANGRIYVIGGAGLNSVVSIGAGEVSWTTEASAPNNISQANGCVYGGKIYVAAGHWNNCPGLYIYDPVEDRWQSRSNQLAEKVPNSPLVAAHNDEIWIMGGTGIDDPRSVYRYNPATGVWSTGPDLPTPLAWGASMEIGGKLFIAGGAYSANEDQGYYIFSERTFRLRAE